MDKCISYYGDCPKTGQTQRIEITYIEVNVAKQLHTGYKKAEFICPLSGNCSNIDKYGRCPVYLDAPENPAL